MRKAVALLLLLLVPVLGFIGYQKTQPTALEGLASGMAGFASSVDPSARADMDRQLKQIKSERVKRGLPFYGGAVLAAVCGVGLIATGGSRREGRSPV